MLPKVKGESNKEHLFVGVSTDGGFGSWMETKKGRRDIPSFIPNNNGLEK